MGLPDTRTSKGFNQSMNMREYQHVGPWFREQIAEQLGMEAVPAQALMWGGFSGATGVDTLIGAPKMELLARHIGQVAKRLGVSPEKARDLILMGKAYSHGGPVHAFAQGGPVAPASSISNVHRMVTGQGLSTRDLSLLIKLATGAPAEWAHGLAGHLMSGDDTFLRGHAAKYPKIAEVIGKVDGMLAGKKPVGSARVDRELVSDAIKASKNQNVKKALSTLMQRN
jgi:hypothetical protein